MEAASRAFLVSNGIEAVAEGSRVIATLLGNLAREDNPKFRRVNLQNAKIQAAVGRTKCGVEVLTAAGFELVEDGAALEFRGEAASPRASAALAAFDAACVACAAPFVLQLRLPALSEARCCCFGAADGRTLVVGSMDNLVRVWPAEAPSGDEPPSALQILEGHANARGASGVLALCLLPDGRVASSGRDGKVAMWSAGSVGGGSSGGGRAAPESVHEAHGDAAGKDVSNKQVVVGLRHDGAGRLLSCGWDHTARIWSDPIGASSPTPIMHAQAVLAVAFLVDGRLATGAGDGSIAVWAVDASGAVQHVAGGTVQAPVRGLAALADGGFAQVGNDGVLRGWTAAAVQNRAAPPVGGYLFSVAALTSAAVQPGAPESLATGGDDGVVRIWTASGPAGFACVQELRMPGSTFALASLPATGALLCACDDAGAFLFSRAASRAAPAPVQKALASDAAAYAAANAASDPPQQPAPAGGAAQAGGGSGGGSVVNGVRYDFAFPVEMGRGSSQIYWNRGDDIDRVAAEFAMRNGVGANELGDIKAFILQAMGSAPGGGAAAGAAPSAAAAAAPAASVQQALVQQLVDMGFDPAQALAGLQRSGWNVEAALSTMLG